jgi:hypothetical protein
MAENVTDELAFGYLNDVRKKFIQTYDFDKMGSYYAYSLNDFVEVLKQLMVIISCNKELL